MKRSHKSPNHVEVLNVLYIIISLVVMVIFLFTSTPQLEEYGSLFSIAMWGVVLAAFIAVLLVVSRLVVRFKK